MNNKKPLILISNDDGYAAKGIRCLVESVREFGDVLVCAPDGGRSGYSCAFSAAKPLMLKQKHAEPGLQVWACNGTPVDCVKMAYSELCDREPDLVIGGINHGDNSSVCSHYSGTMGVVREGCMKSIPSVAFSLCDFDPDADFAPLQRYIKQVVAHVLQNGLPHGVCLNVNFPKAQTFKGVKVCRMCYGLWDKEVVKARHPRGVDYYWLVGEYVNSEPEATDTDSWALDNGYVAITPTRIDVTDYATVKNLKDAFQ